MDKNKDKNKAHGSSAGKPVAGRPTPVKPAPTVKK